MSCSNGIDSYQTFLKPRIDNMNIIDVDQQNIAERGFFCMMSKRKSEGYQ